MLPITSTALSVALHKTEHVALILKGLRTITDARGTSSAFGSFGRIRLLNAWLGKHEATRVDDKRV